MENNFLYKTLCPVCGNTSLFIKSNSLIVCMACAMEYAFDSTLKLAALLTKNKKSEIQNWWGDLFKQLHADHEIMWDKSTLSKYIDALYDMFLLRGHLAVNEMPINELRGKSVLEIGCGAGGHSALFKYKGANLTSCDVTAERAASTAQKLNLIPNYSRVFQADAENLPFVNDSFDIVYSNGVLHHSTNTHICVNEVNRVLKPRGLAVLMLYSKHSMNFWMNIVPRALLTGDIFHMKMENWIGKHTEGKPSTQNQFNPITRVYSKKQLLDLFADFQLISLRKNGYTFDQMCIPKFTQIRTKLLSMLKDNSHMGGKLVYGKSIIIETNFEKFFEKFFGFCWNIQLIKKK